MADGRPIWYTQMLDNTELERGAQQSRKIWQTIESDANQSGLRVGKIWQTAGAAVAGYLSVQAVQQFARQMIDIRGQFQQLEIAFGTMLKSGDRAKQLMGELSQFAATTPFGLQSSASAAKQLLAYGSAAETVIDELRMLGDVAAGTSQPIGDIVYLYGTLRTQGRAYMMDIRQFAGRGIPIYDELAKVLGTSKDKVNEFVSAGKVGFKEIEQAFKNMTSSGGMYGGLMEAQSKSITGRMEQLKDGIDLMFNKIGESSEGVIYKAIDGASSLVENYEQVGKVLAGLIATYGAYRAAIIVNNVVLGIQEQMLLQTALSGQALTKWQALQSVATTRLSAVTNVLNKTMLANSYVLVTTLVVGLVATMWALRDSSTAAERAQERLNKRQEEFTQKEQERRSRIEELIRTIQDETQTEYAKIAAYEELQRLSPDLTDAYSREKLAVADLTATNKRLNEGQDALNFDELISNIDKTRVKISTLKEELGSLLKAQSMSGGAGFAFQVGKIYDEIKVQENLLAKYRKNLEKHNRLMAEVEFNALPPAEKIKIKEAQLAKIRAEMAKVKSVIDEEIAKFPKEVDIGVQVTAGQQPLRWRANTAKEPVWSPLGMQQASYDALKDEERVIQAQIAAQKEKGKEEEKLSEQERKRLAAEAKRRKAEAVRAAQDLAKLRKDLADEAWQSQIAAMQEGFDKQRSQTAKNYETELRDLKEQAVKLAEANKGKLTIGQVSFLDTPENRAALIAGGLAEADVNAFYLNALNRRQMYFNDVAKIDKDENKAALDGFRSFEQEYLRLYAEYQEKRKKAVEDGANEAGLAKADFDFEESIRQLATDFAESTPAFKDWVKTAITDVVKGVSTDSAEAVLQKAITTLEDALTTAKTEVSTLMQGGITEGEGESYKIALAKIVALEKELESLRSKGATSPSQKSIKEWQKLYSTLQKIEKEFTQIGDAIGGSIGEGVKLIGRMTANTLQAVDGIKTLKAGVDATGAALSTMDKAAIALSVIGGAMQIISSISGLFSKNDETERFTQSLRELNAELVQFKLNNRLNSNAHETIFGADVWSQTADDVATAKEALEQYDKKAQEIMTRKVDKYDLLYKDINEAVGGMAVLGKKGNIMWEPDRRLENVVPELFNAETGELEMEALVKFVNDRGDVYERLEQQDKEMLTALVGYWETYTQAMDENVRQYLTDVFGDIGNEMTNALVDAFSNGSDAALAFGDTAESVLEQLTKQMVSSLLFDKVLKDASEKMTQATKIEDSEKRFAAYAEIMKEVVSGVKRVQDESNAIIQAAVDEAARQDLYIFSPDSATRTSASQGFAQASQDSIDSLSGIFTNIESHTYDIRGMMAENQEIMRSNMVVLLVDVSAIRANTNRLENIEDYLLTTTNRLDDVVDELGKFNRG